MANITITTTVEQDARLLAAFTAELRLKVPATGADVKAAVAAYLKSVVLKQEQLAAYKAAATRAFDLT